ncbi:hypothetical protein B0H14DRAFT_3705461 [Mycena olivaceomarginata]|nr:hypothetical protein B0H14DRAFT_3705461 [Mycena olivaceomarginata]
MSRLTTSSVCRMARLSVSNGTPVCRSLSWVIVGIVLLCLFVGTAYCRELGSTKVVTSFAAAPDAFFAKCHSFSSFSPVWNSSNEPTPWDCIQSLSQLPTPVHVRLPGSLHHSGIDDGRPLIFTIDALDEYPEGEANQLLLVLRNLLSKSDLPAFVRFLFTYRPDESILRTFDAIPALNIPIDDEPATVEDIHKFVHAQLAPDRRLAYMVDDVAKAAQTLFQCAAVLCRELTDPRQPKLSWARSAFIQRLRDGPVMSLYDSYKAILDIHFDKTEPKLIKLFQRVMAWVFLEERSDVDCILYCLGSLLSGTTSEDDPISPLHKSLRDFLLDATKSGTFSVDLGLESQEELSLACLKIMNRDLCFNICGLSTLFALNSDVEELSQKVEECIFSGLRYACLATTHQGKKHFIRTQVRPVFTLPALWKSQLLSRLRYRNTQLSPHRPSGVEVAVFAPENLFRENAPSKIHLYSLDPSSSVPAPSSVSPHHSVPRLTPYDHMQPSIKSM